MNRLNNYIRGFSFFGLKFYLPYHISLGPYITLYPLITPLAVARGGLTQDTLIVWEVKVVQVTSLGG